MSVGGVLLWGIILLLNLGGAGVGVYEGDYGILFYVNVAFAALASGLLAIAAYEEWGR